MSNNTREHDMETVKRMCVRNYTIKGDDGKMFTLKKGETFLTSLINQAAAAHGPEPEDSHVVVFSKYWVSVPIDVFD